MFSSKLVKNYPFMLKFRDWERCPSGLWCCSRKAVSGDSGAWVRIPPSPPDYAEAGTIRLIINAHKPLTSAIVYMHAERCWSGLSGTPGERVWLLSPWVRIPPSPPDFAEASCYYYKAVFLNIPSINKDQVYDISKSPG